MENLIFAFVCFIYAAVMSQIEFKSETIKNYNYVINGTVLICGLIGIICFFI